jgi:hypothetical protein
MIESKIPSFETRSNIYGHVTDKTEVTGPLEADKIRQINLITDEESKLDESADEAAANGEEDDELEEEKAVEAAAAANHY